MGDNHERPRPGERAIQAIFQSLRIQCGEVLIQDRQLRILQQRSGKKNTAAFAVRKVKGTRLEYLSAANLTWCEYIRNNRKLFEPWPSWHYLKPLPPPKPS